MVKLRMLRTFRVALDRFTVETWHEGQEYEAPEGLANTLLVDGIAETVRAPAETKVVQPKMKKVTRRGRKSAITTTATDGV